MVKVAKQTQPWRIFVSATKEDMLPYREAVTDALTGMEQIPISMEYFVSAPDSPLDVCLANVRRSQLYIAIVGMRYGSIEEGSGKSFTELEYDEAVKNKIPILAFVIDEDLCPVLPRFVDVGEKAEKLKAFKSKLNSSHMASRYKSAEDLKQLVIRAVNQTIDQVNEKMKAEESEKPSKSGREDYVKGAEMFRRFVLLPKRYNGVEVILRVRMDGQFGTWKMREEFFDAFGFVPGDAIFGNDVTVIGIVMEDIDSRVKTIDFFAEGNNADWILDNGITTGTIFEGRFRLAYESVEEVVSRSDGDTAANIAMLILVEGKMVIGQDAAKRKPRPMSASLTNLLDSNE